jgi:hypothetical protein
LRHTTRTRSKTRTRLLCNNSTGKTFPWNQKKSFLATARQAHTTIKKDFSAASNNNKLPYNICTNSLLFFPSCLRTFFFVLPPPPRFCPRGSQQKKSQAVESLNKICPLLNQSQLEQYYTPLLKRLSLGDWFTSRTSATGLYACGYSLASPATQDDMRK